MKEKQTHLRFWALLLAYCVSELVYKVERAFAQEPEPFYYMRYNTAGDRLCDWLQAFLRDMPWGYDFAEDRSAILKAFRYGCNPMLVAEAVKKRRRIIPYCMHFKDGVGRCYVSL